MASLLERLRTERGAQAVAWVGGLLLLLAVLTLAIDPRGMVQALVVGVQTGGVFALIGLGVALVYKATRVLNFAQGVFGSVPTFLAYTLMIGVANVEDIGSQPDTDQLWWTTILAILVGALLGILTNVLVIRRLASASPVTSLVATAGVALMFVSIELVIFQAQVRSFPRFVPGAPCVGTDDAGECVPFQISGITVSWHTIVVLGVLALCAALLALFFRTAAGTALLATAQEPFAAQLQGVSVAAMSTVAWGMAGALAAVGGLLGAGVYTQVTPGFVTSTFLIPAFIAVVLGGITSMVGAVVGGLILGWVLQIANQLNLSLDLGMNGAPQAAQFLVLLLILAIRPRGLLGKAA